MIFGAIADDFTGGTDLAGMLRDAGARTVLSFGDADVPAGYDACVACLKSRSVEPRYAVSMTLDALERLRERSPRQIYFKYCSTFDSTPEGNIGPAADALLRALQVDFTLAVPALPVNGRTQYMGYLFVNGVPLHESPMKDHPLNPMTDSNLVRWLQMQTTRRVGLLRRPEDAAALRKEGIEIALADVIAQSDLEAIADAFADAPLLTGGSGLGMVLPAVWRKRGWISPEPPPAEPPRGGKALLLAGSCSAATLAQLEAFGGEQIRIDANALMDDPEKETGRVLKAARRQISESNVAVVRSSTTAEEREAVGLDGQIIAEELETMFGVIASTLAPNVDRIVVAGGETSGAVTAALGVMAAEVLRVIDPGVPSIRPIEIPRLTLVLKSGNFGRRDFFQRVLENT
jgi:3-dehydrotetronate 4-kinase